MYVKAPGRIAWIDLPAALPPVWMICVIEDPVGAVAALHELQ